MQKPGKIKQKNCPQKPVQMADTRTGERESVVYWYSI
jgi:hypothetical protein